jgi:WD40 repeat protein
VTASLSPETFPKIHLKTYLDRPATGDPQAGQTREDEEKRVWRELIRPGKPVFDMVAELVADGDPDALELLYSGFTPLHEILADGMDFREDEGFAARTGAPFRPDEHAGVHALRALGGLGLALVAPESAERTLPSALAWYTEARSSVAAPGWGPRGIAKADPRLAPLAELLARASRDERWTPGAALTAAITLRALASPARERGRWRKAVDRLTRTGRPDTTIPGRERGGWRKAIDRLARTGRPGVTLLLAATTGEDRDGVRARLEMSAETGLPPGLVADPARMALFAADPKFGESLNLAWNQTGAARARGTVLWSIVAKEGPVPHIEGGSAGAALAVVLNEVRQLSRPLAEAYVIRRIKGNNAIIGQIDGRGYLQGVEGYESKLNALDNDAKVIVPPGDFEKADKAAKKEKSLQIVPAAHWKNAVRKARGASAKVLLRQGIAFFLVAALAGGVFGLLQAGNAEAQQRLAEAQQRLAAAQKRVSLSARLTSVADSLRGPDPGLAAQFDAAAYRANPTPAADTDLLNDESSPLDTYLPAGTGSGTSDNQPVSALAVSPSGNLVAVVRDSTVQLYDATDPARPPTAVGGQVSTNVQIWPLAFSPDGRVLAAVGAGDAISLWNVTDPAAPSRLSTLSGGGITALAFARAAHLLAVGTTDGDIQLWNVTDPAHPAPLSSPAGPAPRGSAYLGPASITSLMFAGPEAATLWAAAQDGAVETWDTGDPTRPQPTALPLTAGNVSAVAPAVATSFSSAGKLVQTDSYGNSYADDLERYGAGIAATVVPSQVSTGGASPAVISPDGQTIATRDADGTITLYNRVINYPLGPPFPQSASHSAGIPINPMNSPPGLMAFNAAGTVLAADDDGNGLYLWHLPSRYTIDPSLTDISAPLAGFAINGEMQASVLGGDVSAERLSSAPTTNFSMPVPSVPGVAGVGQEAIAVADDRPLLATSDGTEISLVRPDLPDGTGQRLGSVPVTPRALALSVNGTVLVAVDAEGSTTLWNVASPSQPRQLGQPFGADAIGAALSADGTVLALLSGQDPTSESLQLWSLADPAHPERLGDPTAETSGQTVSAMAISPDDQTLALARPSGDVDLIPLGPQPGGRYGVPLASNYDDQSSHAGIDGLAYSPDGVTLTAVNDDSTVRVWNLKPAAAIAAVCAATGPALSAATWQKYVSNAAFSPPCPADATAAGAAPAPVTVPSAQAAAPAICTAGDLTFTLGPLDPQAVARQLVFTNVGHATCLVPGTPVVNLIGPSDAYGTTFSLVPDGVGQENQPDPKNPVTLPPGGKAHMEAKFLTQGPGSSPPPGYIYNWVPRQVQVVLPGSHATLTAPWASSLPVLQVHVPHNPGNYYTPLMPGSAPASAGTAVSPSSAAASLAPTLPPVAGAHLYSGAGYHFGYPDAIAVDGGHLWVASSTSNSVTELNASDGSAIRVLSGGGYQFNTPYAIAVAGGHVWVPNYASHTVTELNASDGSLVRVLPQASYHFSNPQSIAADGTHVWVANMSGNSVTELNASDGSLVRVVSGDNYGFNGPTAIAVDGTHVWVANFGGSVTELNAADGSWVRTVSGASYGFSSPSGIAADSTHVWVTNRDRDSVTELNASDGSVVRDLVTGSYHFDSPEAIASDGTHVWVANVNGNAVTELNADDGSLAKVLIASDYYFDVPSAITVDGARVWVANGAGDSVTELSAG